jgi:hypothetical protein
VTVGGSLVVSGSTTANTFSATQITASGTIITAAGTNSAPAIVPTGDTNTGIFFPAADTIAFAEGGAEAMRIDSSGNVGIGTSSPAASSKLNVYSTASAAARIIMTGTTNMTLLQTTNDSGNFFFGMDNSTGSIFGKGNYSRLVWADGAYPMLFATDGTERARIDSSGNLLIGKTTATANGGDLQVSSGITFPATQVAKSDANTLDDYEEGTWTPTITGGYTSITYSSQSGWYRKVGSLVIVSGRLMFSGTANSTFITMACPFVQGPTGYGGGGIPFSDNPVITNTQPYIANGSSSVLFYTLGTGVQISSSGNITSKWLSFVISMSV